jgi:hypothetical protein
MDGGGCGLHDALNDRRLTSKRLGEVLCLVAVVLSARMLMIEILR